LSYLQIVLEPYVFIKIGEG